MNNITTETISTQDLHDGATVSVNGMTLNPAPFVNITTDQYRQGDLILGGVINVTLNGKILGRGFGAVGGGAESIIRQIGSEGDCTTITISCSGTSVINGIGQIASIQLSEGPDPTWTQIAEYSIVVEVHENFGQKAVRGNAAASQYVSDAEYIKSVSESVNLSFDENSFLVDTIVGAGDKAGQTHIKHDFDITVSGASVGCIGSVSRLTGIEAAERVVQRRIANLENGNITTGLGAPTAQDDLNHHHSAPKYLQVRSLSVDPVSGEVSASGSLIIRPRDHGTMIDAFAEVSVESAKNVNEAGESVIISGNIEGLDPFAYNNFVYNSIFHSASVDKISAANDGWAVIRSKLKNIAYAHIGTGLADDQTTCRSGSLLGICNYQIPEQDLVCPLREINRTLTKNYGQGTVSFTSEWSTRKNCDIEGAAKVDSEVTHQYPTDLFAEFTIPFRGEPLLQNLGTTSKETVAANVTVAINDVACNQVFLNSLEACARSKAQELAQNEGVVIGVWYLTSHSVNYNNVGQLTVSMEWTKNHDC
jgi:hypothetical protein